MIPFIISGKWKKITHWVHEDEGKAEVAKASLIFMLAFFLSHLILTQVLFDAGFESVISLTLTGIIAFEVGQIKNRKFELFPFNPIFHLAKLLF